MSAPELLAQAERVRRALDSAVAAQTAELAWSRLSNACHIHAYEMKPSTSEVTYLCRQVASLLPTTYPCDPDDGCGL